MKDEESRADYDFMLDHPDQVYSHYYRYYRRRMTPRVDVRIVVAVALIVVSAVQYFLARQRYYITHVRSRCVCLAERKFSSICICSRYYSAISYLVETPKYRLQALEHAKALGLLSDKKNRNKSKAEIKEETENTIRKILEENMDIRLDIFEMGVLWCRVEVLIFLFFHAKRWIREAKIHRYIPLPIDVSTDGFSQVYYLVFEVDLEV